MSGAGERICLGWREWIELPEWGLRLRAKMDTGAKSSSLDVESLELLAGGRVRFGVRRGRSGGRVRKVTAVLEGMTRVRSSNGVSERRAVVKTVMRLAGVEKEIVITLTDREKMQHRMLLGREALRGDFLVDAGAEHRVSAAERVPKFGKPGE